MKQELSPSEQFEGATHLTLENIGELDFVPGDRIGPAELLWISTFARGQGLSKYLVQSFIEQIGKGQKVETDDITNTDSWLALERLGYLERAYKSGELLTISDRRSLNSIPIAHVLQSGGLNVQKLELYYFRKGFDYNQVRRSILSSPDSGPSFFRTKIIARS